MMKYNYFHLISFLIIVTIAVFGCKSRSGKNTGSKNIGSSKAIEVNVPKQEKDNPVPEKVIFFIENSGSMFGYVKQANEFKNSLVGLAYLPEFDKIAKSFYFINGKSDTLRKSDISINYIGNDPEILKNKLNPESFSIGDVRYSDLNRMFKIALDSTKNNQITVLVSDCIYDVGTEKDPLTALGIEVHKTQQAFRNRIENEDIQTLIIKTSSRFDGDYFYASKRGSLKISDGYRPFYIIFFGKTRLLNDMLTENSIGNKIAAPYQTARFFVNDDKVIPYQIVPSVKRIGSFKLDFRDNFHIIGAEPFNGKFQFTIAADFSPLPFSESYYASVNNFECLSSNFRVAEVEKIIKKIPGIAGTHLITMFTEKNPLGELEIVLKNVMPEWISATDIADEDHIDNIHTYGFKSLTDAISEAYTFTNNKQKVGYPASFRIKISN